MVESLNDKRAKFPKNKQKEFLKYIENKTQKTASQLASLLKIHPGTLREWKHEKYSIPLKSLKKLCDTANCNLPANVVIKQPFWWTKEAAKLGGQATYKKYGIIGGNQSTRQRHWKKWWNKEGKFKKENTKILKRKTIKKPRLSNDLAEFVGLVLGDGGITNRQITITLHYKNDKQYGVFVAKLIKRLFCVKPSIHYHKKKSVNAIVVSRTALVEFLVKNLGLKIGNKIRQQVDIPNWIKNNQKYALACLRGLVDTDGTIIKHSYNVKTKKYTYKKLAFTSKSIPLLQSVEEILSKLDIKHRRAGRGKYDIRVESRSAMERYFSLIGTHNPKHLKRYQK